MWRIILAASTLLMSANSFAKTTINLYPYGAYGDQTAGTFSLGFNYQCVMGGSENGQGAGGLGTYPTIDSVGLCAANYGTPPIFSLSGTFDATHFYPASPLSDREIANLVAGIPGVKAGTWIQTTSGSNTYRSWITGITPTAITVIGWWIPGQAGYVTPSGVLTANFGVNTKVWGSNIVVKLDNNSFANSAEGMELDVINNQSVNSDYAGMDVVQMGNIVIGGPAFQSRGVWGEGFYARGGSLAGFLYDPTVDMVPVASIGGFATRQNNGEAFISQPSSTGITTYRVDANDGDVSIGPEGGNVSGYATVFFYSSGNAVDDAFISSSGGSGGQNTATITYSAGMHAFVGGPIEVVSGSNYVTISSNGLTINGQVGVSCSGAPDANFKVVGGIVVKC